MFAFGQTVTHHIAGTPTTDAYGDDVAAFTDKTETGVSVQPGNSLESTQNRSDILTSDVALVYNEPVTVTTADEYTLPNGLRYQVFGDPAVYSSPLTGTGVTEVILRRIA